VCSSDLYCVETHGGYFLVRVPYNFKRQHLLEFLGDALPLAKLPM
jgi:hypothetical protein